MAMASRFTLSFNDLFLAHVSLSFFVSFVTGSHIRGFPLRQLPFALHLRHMGFEQVNHVRADALASQGCQGFYFSGEVRRDTA